MQDLKIVQENKPNDIGPHPSADMRRRVTRMLTFVIVSLCYFSSISILVYVLNYSWVFGGIWQMLKRALPETARARVSFPSCADELQEHFDLEELSTGKTNQLKKTLKEM